MDQDTNVRLQFTAAVIRQQLKELTNFTEFQECWQRFEYYNQNVLKAGELKIMDENGQIPSDFQDSTDGLQLAYQAADQQRTCPYPLLGDQWLVITEA